MASVSYQVRGGALRPGHVRWSGQSRVETVVFEGIKELSHSAGAPPFTASSPGKMEKLS